MSPRTPQRTALLIVTGVLSAALVPLAAVRIYDARAGARPEHPALAAAAVPAGQSARAADRNGSVETTEGARGSQRASRARARVRTNVQPRSTAGGTPFIWPVTGARTITSPFGPRDSGFHHGMDIGCAPGQPIYAARAGHVRYAAEARAYGNVVLLDHGGNVQTVYGHFDRLHVAVGSTVGTGQFLGTCGETGNATGTHLHFEVRVGGYVYDPLLYLP